MYRIEESVPEIHGKLQLRSGQRGMCHAEAHQLCCFRSSQDTTVALITIGSRDDANDWMTLFDFNWEHSRVRNSRTDASSARAISMHDSNVWHNFHTLAHSVIGNPQTAIPLGVSWRFRLDFKDCRCVVPRGETDVASLTSLRYSVFLLPVD